MGKKTIIKNIPADTLITLRQSTASFINEASTIHPSLLFKDVTSTSGIQYRHTEYEFNDFAYQRLLPQKFSQLGPFITNGDINGDGLTDFFIGSAATFSGKIFVQQKNQTFHSINLIDSSKVEEDMDCILFDADNDKDLDLLITYGDSQQPVNFISYQPKLFINDGKGHFSLKADAIPNKVTTIAGTVSAADFDNDGDMDLFIRGRVTRQYPLAPKSFILQNTSGVFTDVTTKVCPALQTPGMITSAVWTDFDNDKQIDLIIAGEWMPIRFF